MTMSSVHAAEIRKGRRGGIIAPFVVFAACATLGAEAAPFSCREYEESGTERVARRLERSMTRVRLRRYFRHGMLPQLIAFEASVRHGSVTRAAEELSLAQPTVSCLIRKLSDTLGAPVTQLRGRRIEATALGNEVLMLCQEVFTSFERFDMKRPGPVPANGSDDDDEEHGVPRADRS